MRGMFNGKISPADSNTRQMSDQNLTISKDKPKANLFVRQPDEPNKVETQKNADKLKHTKGSKPKSKLITLITRGVVYKVPLDTFNKLPDSRLGKLKTLIESKKSAMTFEDVCDKWDLKSNTFYFNKDPAILNMILNYYSVEKFHIEDSACGYFLSEDFEYWQVDEMLLERCCSQKYYVAIDTIEEKQKDEADIITKYKEKDNFGTRFFPDFRSKVWAVLEYKETTLSKVIMLLFKTISRI